MDVSQVFADACDLWSRARTRWMPYREAIGDELGFSLDLDHYADDTGQTRDRRRIQPRGQELFSLIRHKASQISKSELYINPRPVDDTADPTTAEYARVALEWEIGHPQKGYSELRELVVVGALAARAWGMALDFDDEIGAYGEILPRAVDPRCLMWAPDYHSMHDPRCPWMTEEVRMRVSRAKRMKGWKNTDQLVPDSVASDPTLRGEYLSGVAPIDLDLEDEVTIVKLWYRRDETTKKREVPDSFRQLKPDERYMACPSCGYQSDTQGQLQRQEDDPSFQHPQVQPCPECQQQAMQAQQQQAQSGIVAGPMAGPPPVNMMERVDAMVTEEEVLAYPDGRLIIFAPNCGIVLWDDDWPFRVRSFPYLWYTAYPHPTKPMGISDTTANWSLQLVSNALMRMGYEQMSENRDLTLIPELGIVDVYGQPFRFADEQGRVGFYNTDLPPSGVMHFQGSGLNQAWGVFFGQVQGVFKGNMGTSDLGLTPQMSKDIPVGTVQQLVETGEVPVDMHIRRLRRAESIFFGVWLDMIRATYTEQRIVRMRGPEGSDVMQRLRGCDIPNVDVVVEGEPRSLSSLQADSIEAFNQLLQIPAPFRRVYAEVHNFPPSVVQKMEQAQAEMDNMQSAPKVDPVALLQALSQWVKAGGVIAPDQEEAALEGAGLPPPQMMSQRPGAPPPPPMPGGGAPSPEAVSGAPEPDALATGGGTGAPPPSQGPQ